MGNSDWTSLLAKSLMWLRCSWIWSGQQFISKRRNTKSKEVLPLSCEVQSRSPCSLNSWWCLGSILVSDFASSLSKEITYVDFISINLACYQQLTEDLLQLRDLSALGYTRNTQSQIRNPKQWEASQLKERVTGVHSSCNLGKAWTELIQRPAVSRKASLPLRTTLKGVPAPGEITAVQPSCLAGRAPGQFT